MKGDPSLNKSDSDISSALHVEMDPKTIEVREAPKSVFIGRDKYRGFLIGTVISLMFVTLFLIADTVIYSYENDIFKEVFSYHSGVGNGFDILAYIVLFLSMMIPTVVPNIGRRFAIPFMLLIVCCYLYIPAFLLRWSLKDSYSFSEIVIVIYLSWISSVIGLFINVVSMKNRFNPNLGLIIAAILYTILLVVHVYVLELMSAYFIEYGLMVGGTCLLALYMNLDVQFMLNKRNDYYLTSDWFLGFVHLHTDIFYRFWIDIFRENVDNVDKNLSLKSIVLTNSIKKSKLAPISEANEESDTEDIDRSEAYGVQGSK